MRELNGFWLFVSSCLPGCGQMYQGYMKRGASLLALFWVTVCITSILQIDALGVLIAAIWLYAYFDSYNLRALCKEGRPMQDTYLFGSDDDSLSGIFHGKGRKILGWVLIFVGAYALLELLADMVDSQTLRSALGNTVPKALLTGLIIWLGVWFIRGPKRPDSADSFENYSPASGDTDAGTSDSSASEIPSVPEEMPKEDDRHE